VRQHHYERLEFLGDRVLGLVIADLLWHRFEHEPEGDLTSRLGDLVRRDTLARVAREIGLDRHLRLSPTEAAAVACVYAALVTAFVFRELGWRDMVEAAASTVLFTGQILIIVACAGVFAWLLTVNQVPAAMTAWLQSFNVSAWMLLLAINVLLLLVGCFLDPLSAILLLSPLLVPLVKAAGIDTVHFGIVVTVNLAIGLFHPPFGINIFVAQSVLGLKLETIYRGIIPFVIIYLVALALITYIPEISLIGVRYLLAK